MSDTHDAQMLELENLAHIHREESECGHSALDHQLMKAMADGALAVMITNLKLLMDMGAPSVPLLQTLMKAEMEAVGTSAAWQIVEFAWDDLTREGGESDV